VRGNEGAGKRGGEIRSGILYDYRFLEFRRWATGDGARGGDELKIGGQEQD